jgi:cell division ATPase FtsA
MKITIHVMSCNRNSHELVDFIFNRLIDGEVVIGVGGKALALPGVIDAWVYHFKKNVRVAGVALGETGSNTGPEGLRELIERIDNSEPPPPKPRKDKPTQIDIC